MKSRLRTKVWWPKIDNDAEKLVKSCKGCTLVSTPSLPNPMKRRELPSQPWVDVAIDFLGPLPSNEYLFVIVDYYSRYKEIKIMRDTTAKKTTEVLQEIFSRTGYPASITADNGPQFVSSEFKNYCQENGITLFNTIPYWPQQNGEVERQNRDILKRIKISKALNKNWKNELLDYMVMYNSTPHSVTGKTPAELFYGRQFRDKIPSLTDIGNKTDSEVRDNDRVSKEKGKEYSDRKRKAQTSILADGDKVYVKNLNKDNKTCPDFNPIPHTVVSRNGADVKIRNEQTGRELRRNVLHLKKVEGEWRICEQEDEHTRDLQEATDQE